MRLAAKLWLVGVLGCVGTGSATAQNLEEFFGGLGRQTQQPRRAVTQAEWERLSPGEILCVDNRLRRNRRSVNTLIDRGIGPSDNRVAGIVSDCRTATDAAVPNSATPAAPVTARDNAVYVINGLSLGGNVQVGSTIYLDYACAPSQLYAGFTACQRQTAERSRRRRISESTAFLHGADGSAAYIEQKLEPVVMDDDDARDEISRLSESYGQARLLPVLDARGKPNGVIASWGAVSLQPLESERRAALATGTDDTPGMLIDSIGDPQRSAQLGLPVYRLGGGAGYVWAASWNGRGRGTLRVLAIDAAKLPGASVETRATEPTVATAEPPKPTENTALSATPVAPPAPVQVPKPADAAPVAPAPKAAAPAPADIRVVGPPIELRPNVPAVSSATTSEATGGSNGLVVFLIALVVVLLGAVGYLWRKSRMGPPVAAAKSPAAAAATPAADPVAPKSEKMDLPALVPTESPDSIAASKADMDVPKDAAMTSPVSDMTKPDRVVPPKVVTSGDK
jgi:hypothetical protein